jgi:hypothetical protein
MPIANVVMTTSKVVIASYRILVTSILGYYLIKETIRREKYGRKHHSDGPSLGAKRGGSRDQESG